MGDSEPAGDSMPAVESMSDGSSEPPLAGSQALIGLLWHDAETAMVVVDGERRIRHLNPMALATVRRRGLGVGDVLNEFSTQITRADDRQAYATSEGPLERALRGETVRRETLHIHHSEDDEPRRMVLSAQPMTLDDGTLGALLVWHDVTDGRDFAERSRLELARLGQLLEGATDYAIIMLDPAGRVRSWSAAAERMQGYSNHEAIGLPYATFFNQDDRAAGLPAEILREAVTHGKTQTEGKRLRADGSVFWAHAALTAMRDEAGELRGFVKVTHDVSERLANERAVVELNELLEERAAERTVQLDQQAADLAAVNAELEAFSYSVSHDLRAPLRAMSGFARIIEQDFAEELPEQVIHYLGRVTENAQQMGSLIDALLTFSRMQRQIMHSAPVDMIQVVRECWTALTPARGDRRIEFVLGPLPSAKGDRQLIRQVWMNLLDNAIKYTGRLDAARIEVRAETAEDGDAVIYLVQDNGAGFDMKYAAKIGQVFQRLHHTEDFAGIGIGLALVQRIVQRHGGRMTAVGEPGAGATFGFSLHSERAVGAA
jgi:PAS domain S-box-containing protein